MGPWIVPQDEVPDPHALGLRYRVNGVVKQDSSTAHFFFNIPTVIRWLSQGLSLSPGDVIAMGTPAGVGFARNPPEFLKPGDLMECEVDGIGTLSNRVAAMSFRDRGMEGLNRRAGHSTPLPSIQTVLLSTFDGYLAGSGGFDLWKPQSKDSVPQFCIYSCLVNDLGKRELPVVFACLVLPDDIHFINPFG